MKLLHVKCTLCDDRTTVGAVVEHRGMRWICPGCIALFDSDESRVKSAIDLMERKIREQGGEPR